MVKRIIFSIVTCLCLLFYRDATGQNEAKTIVVMDKLTHKVPDANVTYLDAMASAIKTIPAVKVIIEPTDIAWNNFEKIKEANPHLVIIHLNGFTAPDADIEGYNKLIRFFIAMKDTKTRFLVFSGAMGMEGGGASKYVIGILEKDSGLTGRFRTFAVNRENTGATFAHKEVTDDFKNTVSAILRH